MQLEIILRLEDGGMKNPTSTLQRPNITTFTRHDVEVQGRLTSLHHPTS